MCLNATLSTTTVRITATLSIECHYAFNSIVLSVIIILIVIMLIVVLQNVMVPYKDDRLPFA
jgi:hypothetical protein